MTNAKPDWWTSDHWSTPIEIIEKLREEFGDFDLDPCCRPETAKASNFYTAEQDGLSQPWFGKVFLNPPYSKPGPWLKRSLEQIESGCCSLVVALLPVRTDTRWFHEYVNNKADIRFVRGRIKWIGWQGTPIPNPKDPSLLAIYKREPNAHRAAKYLLGECIKKFVEVGQACGEENIGMVDELGIIELRQRCDNFIRMNSTVITGATAVTTCQAGCL